MEIRQIQHGTPDYEASVALRDRVLRKPLNLKFDPLDLAKEEKDIHLVGFINNKAVATLMLCDIDREIIQMRQVAVDKDFQRQGLGKELVLYSEAFARMKGYKIMYLHARSVATEFYKTLGYEIVGEGFMEVNIPHFAMQKELQ